MNKLLTATPAFGPGCPWYDLHQRFPPNIDWCEEKLCSLVVTPFNSWTNLAYLLVALLMWLGARNSSQPSLRLFAPATAVTGITSFVYHQSLNIFCQTLDFLGMYACCMLLLMANMQRTHSWAPGRRGMIHYWIAVGALTGLTAASFLLGIAAQIYVAVLILLIIWTELAQAARSRRYFWLSILAMAAASVLSALDLARVVCEAANHWFQPHGLWHIMTALAIYLAFLHTRHAARR